MSDEKIVNWGDYFICKTCGKKVERGIIAATMHHSECSFMDLETVYTEDADFEIIEPLQLPESKK